MPRFFRVFVCLVLVCCILVNISPIRARASATASFIALGALAVLIAGTAGIVFNTKTVDDFVAIGNSLSKSLDQLADTVEKQSEVIAFFADASGLISMFSDAPNDGGFKSKVINISRFILSALGVWISSIAMDGGIKYTPPLEYTDYAYYNGALLPDHSKVSLTRTYSAIGYNKTSDTFSLYFSHTLPIYSPNPIYVGQYSLTLQHWVKYEYDPQTVAWVNLSSSTGTTWAAFQSSTTDYLCETLLWANFDICDENGYLIFEATEPLYEFEEILEAYCVPGSPLEDENGVPAPEEIEKKLPQVIDPSKLLQNTGKADLNQAVQDVMQQLADGTLTHQQYVDSISVPSDIVVPDSTVPGDDDDDIVSSPDVPEMLPYALNLTDFFPFCIPFDIYDFFSALIAAPEAPQFHWEIQDLSGRSYSIDIDLSCWDSLAATFRSMQLALFIVGLAVASRKFIKW